MRHIYSQTLENGAFHLCSQASVVYPCLALLLTIHSTGSHTCMYICGLLLYRVRYQLTKHSAAYRGVVRGRGLHRSNDAQLRAQCGNHLGTVLQICFNPEELGRDEFLMVLLQKLVRHEMEDSERLAVARDWTQLP